MNVFIFQFEIGGESFCDEQLGNENFFVFGLYVIFAIAGIPVPLVAAINLRIISIARRRAREMALIRVSTPSRPPRLRHKLSLHSFTQIWKSILTATIVVGTMVISVTPFTAVMAQIVISPPKSLSDLQHAIEKFSVGAILMIFPFVVNPVIYSMRLPQIKKCYQREWNRFVRVIRSR
jgi:hypothetical protein